ncbi:hypothetical protein GN244_ATG09462 [Phytophthora infestans]|uniref:Uncharacterized protein n=1 Tax=Phytophthora infestans TaxID=4787 RepID=A0A833WJU6_PHYIN|nr:hypothetical protein GN244_ATG09462 [Phytophthora infestans]
MAGVGNNWNESVSGTDTGTIREGANANSAFGAREPATRLGNGTGASSEEGPQAVVVGCEDDVEAVGAAVADAA